VTVSNYNRPTPTPEWHPLLSPLELAVDGAQASLDRLDFTLAQATAALSILNCPPAARMSPVIGDLYDSGDMHRAEGFDPCPGERFHSYVEAAGVAFALEEQAALVPDYCDRCEGFHLVLERAVSAEFGAD
jgi:hypothetical protein